MLEVEAPGDADGGFPEAGAQPAYKVLRGVVRGVGIQGVVSGQRVQQQSVVLDGAGEWADVVQGPGQGEHAVLAHATEGRFHADGTAEGGGDADRAAGVGSQRAVDEVRRDGRPRASAGAAGDPGGIVGVPRGSETRAVARWTVGELVGVRLAQNDGAGVAQPEHDRCVVIGEVILEESRSHRGTRSLGEDQILQAQRHAVQRPPVGAARDLRFGLRRLLERPLARDGYEGVGLVGLDARQARLCHLDRGEALLPQL